MISASYNGVVWINLNPFQMHGCSLAMTPIIDALRATCSLTSTRMKIRRQTHRVTGLYPRMRAPKRLQFSQNQCRTRAHVKVTFIPVEARNECTWGTRSVDRRCGTRVILPFKSLKVRSSRSKRCRRRQRRRGFHPRPRQRCPSVRRRTCGARSDPRTKAKMRRIQTPTIHLALRIGTMIFSRRRFCIRRRRQMIKRRRIIESPPNRRHKRNQNHPGIRPLARHAVW